MLSFLKKTPPPAEIFFYNTLTKSKEAFKALSGRRVKMYTCGPTVYDYAHIGNLRAYVFADVVRRTLEYAGYELKQVVNVTDVGHLQGDLDEGEDKMTAGLMRRNLPLTIENMRALGEEYASLFIEDLRELNIELPFKFPHASDHIPEQIAYISALTQKGYTYRTKDGVYFDTTKLPTYGRLGGSASPEHARIAPHPEKHDQRDFALWKFNEALGWEAPWGKGFPGWHIECVAMAQKYLGREFDIHTGGVDHIPVHHNNEIAEAEAVTGKTLARYWMHGAFITVEAKRIGKSEGNAIRLYQLREKGITPLAYRYLILTAHYRQTMNFTWEALEGAHTALMRARRVFADLPEGGLVSPGWRARFEEAIYDDLDMPKAVALMWELLKDPLLSPQEKRATVLDFDRVLGLGFRAPHRHETERIVVQAEQIPEEVRALGTERDQARQAGDWARADQIRREIEERGFSIEDGPGGSSIHHRPNML